MNERQRTGEAAELAIADYMRAPESAARRTIAIAATTNALDVYRAWRDGPHEVEPLLFGDAELVAILALLAAKRAGAHTNDATARLVSLVDGAFTRDVIARKGAS